MPQHKSAEKRLRQNEKRRAHNKQYKSRMRTMVNKVREAEEKEEAEELLRETKSLLDRLASKGIIHANKAARYKSDLEQHVNEM